MQVARPRDDEEAALAALRGLDVLDTEPEAEFDALVRAASAVCGTPISLISLVDAERQWFKSVVGLPGVTETPREVAFCAHAVLGDELFFVPDATQDPRFQDNPLVTGAPDIRFYAGAPITLDDQRIGTLCVIDRRPRELDATQREVLTCLAEAASRALRGRHAIRLNKAAVEAAARAALVLKHSADAIVGLDAGGHVARWNPAAEALFGYAADQIIGQPLDILLPAQGLQEEDSVWQRLADGRAHTYETARLRRDGVRVDVSVTAVPELDAAGRLIGATKFMRDISERAAAARQLAQSEARLRRLYESTPAMLHSIDRQGRMLAISDLWLQKLGYSREEVIGRFAPDLLTPASRQKAVDEVLPRLFSQGRVDDVAYQVQTRKGQVLDVLLSAVVERDEQGQPLHSLSVLVDVTERRQAERALAEKRDVADALQRDLSNILDAVPSMIGYWDARQLNRFANQAYYDWFGIEPGTLPGLHISEMMGPALYALNRPHIEAVLRGEEQVFEREIPHRDGSSVRHALTRYLPDLRDGDVRGFYVLSFDVSRMKATQRELQTLNETLAERTRQAEAANVAKSAFLANMSHEIRTPMNAILGMLALLQKTELTVRQADYAAKTEGAARALLGLLNDILDFSKVEAGKMTLDPQPFEVDRLLRDLSVILAANVGGKPIELLFDLDKHLPRRLVADETRLRQILINLGANAIKFTEQGSVTLSIAVLARQADEVTLEIAVRDTGIGIAPENQERIFSAFTQAEASTTRRFGGTGLGLAICQRLVAMMGGGLRLDSALGHGSRFHFQLTLPLAGADAPEAAQPAPPVGTLRALIVDDNAEAREVLLRMALSLGWQADVADSGEGALALLAEQPGGYGAVFVDWQMPGLDGWQTCRLIREQALADTAPLLVMVTAHGREMLAARSEDEQGLLSGFLVKPVTASMLQDAMAEARSAGQVAPEPRRAAPAALRRLAGLRVLLAEDNENNQQVARELLEGEGAEVVIAANGQAAVAAAAAADAAFDVVLMDLQMPVMDGYTATARLRQDPRHGRLPIIAMTANVMASDREACLAAGMDDHVGKPFDLDELVRTMRRHTGRSEDAPPTAQPPAAAAWPAAVLERARAASVDLVPAVTRMGGQASVYARMLASFLRDMPGLQARLRSAVAAADPVAAARLTHTLKGLAGTLGAQALAALASDAEAGLGLVVRSGLEGDLADADAHADAEAECARACAAVDAAIDAAFSPLSELLAGLSAVRPAAQAAGPTTVLTAAESPALLAELRQLARALADSDMGATTLMSQLADRFGGGLGVRLEPLEAAVTSLDFDTALNHCANLIEEYAA